MASLAPWHEFGEEPDTRQWYLAVAVSGRTTTPLHPIAKSPRGRGGCNATHLYRSVCQSFCCELP